MKKIDNNKQIKNKQLKGNKNKVNDQIKNKYLKYKVINKLNNLKIDDYRQKELISW